jgi:uncharacterized Zn finger protein (UPF0148 family)
MSLVNALSLLHSGHLVIHHETAYAIVDERLVICRFNREEHSITHYFESEQSINKLFELFETFKSQSGVNVFMRPPIPESLVCEDGLLYDFSKLLETICPDCGTDCNRKTVIRHGKYARCPGCGRNYWRASLISGERETATPKKYRFKADDALGEKSVSPEVKKKMKAEDEERLVEQLIEARLANPKPITKRLVVS